MSERSSGRITMGRGSTLAFALVVLASYFAMFSALQDGISLVKLGLIMVLGVAYITNGIYGYRYCGRHPSITNRLVYFALQIPLGGAIVYLGRGAGFNALILLPLVGHAVVLLSRDWQLIVNTIIILTYVLSVRQFSPGWEPVWAGLPTFLAGAIFIMIFTQMAVNEENARMEVERLVDELEAANQRLRGYAVQAEELAINKERNRLAREIHDGLGHYLTGIFMQVQAARALTGSVSPQAQEALNNAQKLAQDALVDVRQSVASLRASPYEGQPLPQVISRIIDDCQCEIFQTDFQVRGEPRPLIPQIHQTFFRAVQEGLNNARKHSQASMVDILLDYQDPSCIHLSIMDNGQGTESMDGGFGLIGLKERANLLGGEFHTTSTPGRGF